MSQAQRLAEAQNLADQSALHSEVVIRQLSGAAEMRSASALLAEVWRLEAGNSLIPPGMLVALAHADNYVSGAFRGELLIGAAVGFFHPPAAKALHSHITGVRRDYAVAGVGYAIKLHQRAWCLERGATTMTWTYDPLVARNAYFNLRKLGGRSTEYLPDHYGEMSDGLNLGQPSDRMLLTWNLEEFRQAGAPPSKPSFAALSRADGRPGIDLNVPADALSVRLELPEDIESLRTENPELAGEWRSALRTASLTLLTDGWQFVDFERSGYYVAERNPT
jgi:predicted GNAT superfamily acetyltransferase